MWLTGGNEKQGHINYPAPLEITLPSGKQVKVRGYISAGTMMKFAALPRTGAPRARFVALVSKSVVDDEASIEELSGLPDDKLIEIGLAPKFGYEQEFGATEEPDFFTRFIYVLDDHLEKNEAIMKKFVRGQFAQSIEETTRLKTAAATALQSYQTNTTDLSKLLAGYTPPGVKPISFSSRFLGRIGTSLKSKKASRARWSKSQKILRLQTRVICE